MRNIFCLIVLLLAGCTSRTLYGPCIGIADHRDPRLLYKMSIRNVSLGIIFFELVIPPVDVLANKTFCPVGIAEGLD